MKQLMHKELKLSTALITWIFLLFGFMTLIPGYPILVGVFFVCMGIFYSFQFSREDDDILYTSLLPIKKKDVVTAKYICVVFLEMISFIIMVGMTILRMTVLKDMVAYVSNPLMAADITFLSFALIIFALFNFVFIRGFFKTAYYYGKPFIFFCITAFIVVGLGESLHYMPGMSFLNEVSGDGLNMQWPLFIVCIVVYGLLTYFSMKSSQKRFEKLDL